MTEEYVNNDAEDASESSDGLDEDLQHELDEALGDVSLMDLMDAEEAEIPTDQPKAEGVKRGKVIAVHGDDIFIDMGGKSQGVLAAEQLKDKPLPEVGDDIEVTIEGYDRTDGLLILSIEGAVKAATWQTLEEGQIVEGRVTGHNKGGLEIDINGIKAFMPVSHIELVRVEDLTPYVNRRLQCQVMDIIRSEQKVVVSRRDLLKQEEAKARQQTFDALAEGQTVTGSVRTIMPYGAFVDIGGIDGLLHVGDMSWTRVHDPHDIVKEGQQIEVMVLKIDRETRKLSLGLKQITPDPWSNAENKWPVDSTVTGRVTRNAEFGSFVELEEGVEGLVPISELSYHGRVRHPDDVLKVGDVVTVKVLNIDLERRRIGLSVKQVGDDPWMGASARWPTDSVVEGVVKQIAEFGAFVELTPGVQGLVHISEVSDKRVRTVGEALQVEQTVRAKVLEVDEDRRRISLSIKQLIEMPDYTGMPSEESEPQRPRKKRKKPLRGGLESGFFGKE
ncbi:MAG: S1 RNA-binding domain-containing protein [Planctomycetota bacterium]|jgi:small subunit ribosomal protein S1